MPGCPMGSRLAPSTVLRLTLDEFSRKCLAIRVRRSFPARRVIAVPEPLLATTSEPAFLRSDNGPEFIAHAIQAWLAAWGAQTYYIDPGSSWQDTVGQSFNGRFRDKG